MELNKWNGKRILIIGASDFQLPAVIKAKEMGITVAVADRNPEAEAIAYADQYYQVSTIDEQGVYEAAKAFRADGIVTLCTDMPMRALAYACEQLGLVGPNETTAVLATDKGAMIKAFENGNVSHPAYRVISKGTDLKLNYDQIMFPVITKPTDNSGSRGIMLVRSKEEFEEAVDYSSLNGRTGEVIVEEYMEGPEVSVEVMVINGTPHVLQITDKLTTGAPHFVEIGHSQPSRLPEKVKEQISELVKQAVRAIQYRDGAAHAEVIVTKDGPKMVEIGARMGGGCITTHLVPLSTGIDMTKSMIETALGEEPDIQRKYERGAAVRFLIPKAGRIVRISGKEEAEAIPGIKQVTIQCAAGQELKELENGTNRIGYVIAQADSPEEAVAVCEKALEKIKIEVR